MLNIKNHRWIRQIISLFIIIIITSSYCIPVHAEITIPTDLQNNLIFKTPITTEEQTELYRAWNNTPESVRNALNRRGVQIICTNVSNTYNNTVPYTNVTILGTYSPGARTVVQTNDGTWKVRSFNTQPYIAIQPSDDNMTNILYHEIGHCVSDCNPNPCQQFTLAQTEEFVQLYKKYRYVIASYDSISEINTYSSIEMFAESYRITMLNPAWLQINAPELLEYIYQSIDIFAKFEYDMA